MADQDLAGLPTIQRWHATGDYAYPAEEREDGEFVEYEAYCALARENADLHTTVTSMQEDMSAMLALTDRVQAERDEAQAELSEAKGQFEHMDAENNRLRNELAALKRRIAEASGGIVTQLVKHLGSHGPDAATIEAYPAAFDLEIGQRVALLPVGGE